MSRLSALLLLLGSAAGADEETYHVGHHPKFVNITFESHADLETTIGTTNLASGEIRADLEKGTGSVSIRVPVASLKTGIDLRDEHLRSEHWLDTKKFPEISFQSKKVRRQKDRLEVTGDFTMHGVSKEMTVNVEWRDLPDAAVKKAKFPDGRWLKFSGEFQVKLSDFGVKIPDLAVGKLTDEWTVKMAIFASTAKIENK